MSALGTYACFESWMPWSMDAFFNAVPMQRYNDEMITACACQLFINYRLWQPMNYRNQYKLSGAHLSSNVRRLTSAKPNQIRFFNFLIFTQRPWPSVSSFVANWTCFAAVVIGYSKENLKTHTGPLPSLPYLPLPAFPSLSPFPPLPLEVESLKSS